jgi:hypothetical protein
MIHNNLKNLNKMKTLIFTTILTAALFLTSINSKADGIDSSSANAKITASSISTIRDFAFRLDLSQILQAAETVDLSDLLSLGSKSITPSSNTKVPFAFVLDTNQINTEAQQVDLSELENN